LGLRERGEEHHGPRYGLVGRLRVVLISVELFLAAQPDQIVALDSEARVQGSGSRFRFQGLWSRVQGSRFRVQDSKFEVSISWERGVARTRIVLVQEQVGGGGWDRDSEHEFPSGRGKGIDVRMERGLSKHFGKLEHVPCPDIRATEVKIGDSGRVSRPIM